MLPESFRDALRSLRRSPGFTAMVVGIFAIGIGLNAAIFTVVDCVLLRPLGYHDADRIVAVNTRFVQENRLHTRIGGGDYVDLSQQVRGLEATAYLNVGTGGVQAHGQSTLVPLAYASPHFGEVMGVTPIAGRLFGHNDAKGTEALIGARYAAEQFGSPEAAVGQALRADQSLYTVVGVLPEGFAYPDDTAVWLEADAQPRYLNRTAYNQRAIAKRRTDVTAGQLDAELATFSRQLQQSYPEDSNKLLEVLPLQDSVTKNIKPTLHLLMGSVGVLLLIVCANVTHLQLVRATRQMREVAVRSALGASRMRLAMRALLEVAILSVASCLGAMLLAAPALRLLVHLAPAGLPRLAEVHLNLRVVLFSFLVTFAVMSATALMPIWRSWHVDQSSVLRQDSARGLESRGAIRLRGAFLVVQVALTLVLAASAVLLSRQLIAQSHEDLGFDMGHLYTLNASMIETAAAPDPKQLGKEEEARLETIADNARIARLNSALLTLRSTPGVEAAEAIVGAPLGFDTSNVSYGVKGKHSFVPPYNNLPIAEVRPITPATLDLLHIPLLRGRPLNDSDNASSTNVLLINKAVADHVFPGEDPIGRQVVSGYDRTAAWTIVGVVGNVKNTPGEEPEQSFYVPVAQHPGRATDMQYLVRTQPGANLSTEKLRLALQAAHGDIAVRSTTMAENFSELQRDLRFRTLLFQGFAAVSVLLAMLGMYGATAYSVAQRTFEFGLRMALGATREQVVGSVLGKSAGVALGGTLLGLGLFLLFVRTLATLTGKLAIDLPALALASLAIVLLAMLAAALPARRASNIDPMRALRMD